MTSDNLKQHGWYQLTGPTASLDHAFPKMAIVCIFAFPDRIAIYIAICDLIFSINLLVDYSISFHTGALAKGTLCTVLAFVVDVSSSFQVVFIAFLAIAAFTAIVKNKPVYFGKYDWALLSISSVVPLVIAITFLCLGALGPSEFWVQTNLGPN